jgi:uncharacterized protein
MKMSPVSWIVFILTIVGGLNWGLIGAFNFNLVSAILGDGIVAKVVYIIVGLAALWLLVDGIMKSSKTEAQAVAPQM